jgi:hypothetical protein
MMICEVHEDLAPSAHHFLCQREEFGRSANWDPLFNYPWKTAEFPYGYALVDGEQIHGFLGTVYARRTINGKSTIFCNISTWVVDESYRAGLGKAGRGLGKRLVEPVLAHKDVVVTALTPNVLSAKSCESMGFKRLDSEQAVIPVFPGFRGWSGFGSSRKLAISFKPREISKRLTEKEREICNDHRDLPCKHFLIDSPKTGEYCYGIATTGPIRRLAMVGGRVLNLCYLSNSEFFARHFWSFAGLLWDEDRIAAVRYDKRMIPQTVSTLSRRKVAPRLFHAAEIGGPQVDLLYSELVLFNFY